MKFMFIFCDMLMGTNMSTFNNQFKSEDTELDMFLKELGGIAYTNAFSGTPESYRALASFITGLLPKNNGVTSYMNRANNAINIDSNNIFKVLYDNNFQIIMHCPGKNVFELLPINHNKIMKVFRTVDKSVLKFKELECTNSAIFLNLIEYHYAIDKFNNRKFPEYKANVEGQKDIMKILKKVFRNIDKEEFDSIFLFSDHGCNLYSDFKKKITKQIMQVSSSRFPLTESRTKIAMLWRKKGDENIVKDISLTSIMDIFPTVLELLNLSNSKLDGISLNRIRGGGLSGHKFIIFEDFDNYFMGLPGDTPRVWGIRTKNFYYIENLYTNIIFRIRDDKYYNIYSENYINVDKIHRILTKYSCSYKFVMEEKERYLNFYKALCFKLRYPYKYCFIKNILKIYKLISNDTDFRIEYLDNLLLEYKELM